MKRLSLFFTVILSSLAVQAFVLFRLPPFQLVKYSHAADLLLQGKLQGERILDFSPLYLQLNVLLQKLDAPSSVLLWIQISCVALSTGLLFLLLSRHFRTWIAIAGAVAFLFDRSLMVYTYVFEPEPFLLLFLIASAYLASLQKTGAPLVAGTCLGLAILTRPNFVPVLLAIPFYYKFNSVGSVWRKKASLFLLPALLCVAAIWVRNATIMGYFSPFVMNPGTVFYEGNNPNSWGMSAVYPPVLNQVSMRYSKEPDYHHQLYRDFARRIKSDNLSLSEVNSYWSGKAFNFLRDHPARTFRLVVTKIFHVFHAFQWHDLSVAYWTERTLEQLWIMPTPFPLVSALCIAGLLILRSEWKKHLMIYAIFFTQFFLMVIIYVSARQRTAILFLFLFFACAAIDRFFVQKKSRWLLIVVAILSISLQIQTDLMKEERHLWDSLRESNSHLTRSYQLRNQGHLDEAAMESARSLALAPGLIDSRRPANLDFGEQGFAAKAIPFSQTENNAQWMDRAVLLLEAGKIKEAKQIFQKLNEYGYKVKRDDYQSSELKFYLARCALKESESRKALDYLKKAIESSPGDPSSLAYLNALTGHSEYQEQLFRYFDEIDASFVLGNAHLEIGNPKAAVRYFQYVTRMLPEFRQGFLYLASAFAKAGMYNEAAAQYRKAISMNPDPVFFESWILTTFQQLARQNDASFHHYSYGVVLRQFGHFDEALVEQRKAAAGDAKNPEIAREIKNLEKVLSNRST